MPTKTDRILSYLPFTFLAARRMSALRAVVGSVGNELQLAETSLARIMRSHWVDSADEGAVLIDDLERLASMYGLVAMRDDARVQLESVEQFRRRLKRHVKTLLEGRVNVRGLINTAAELLDVTIPEGDDIDYWWNRTLRETITVEPRGEDAAERIFGVNSVDVRGVDASPAVVQGTVDLSQGIDLQNGAILRIQIDDSAPATIDLSEGAADIHSISIHAIRDAINKEFPGSATDDGQFLTLRSSKAGAEGRIEFEEAPGDAASAVFGVPAHIYTGADGLPAEVHSAVDLGGGVDLTGERFLRIVIDGTQRAEIDCAASTPAVTTLKDITDAINQALGIEVASAKDGKLNLRSPSVGSSSSIFIQEPAAQSATRKLLGQQPSFSLGSDARPAIAPGVRDLTAGVDLSEHAVIRVSIDGGPFININCAGATPASTSAEEIVARIEAALGPGSASIRRGKIQLSSSTVGKTGQIVFEPAEQGDALEAIFGYGPRIFHGTPALAASFEGTADLSDPDKINFFAVYRVAIQVDGHDPVEVDFAQQKGLKPTEIAAIMDQALAEALGIDPKSGKHIAFAKTKTVGLTSLSTGHISQISVVPIEREVRRRFVSRAPILDEAAPIVLGFAQRSAKGKEATSARVDGQVDLQFGVDLRTDRWVSISIDAEDPITIDCAGARPRTTTIDEIFDKLSAEPTADKPGLGKDHVRQDGKRLSLVSTATGVGSRIAFAPVRIQDASERVFGLREGEQRGQEAGRVVFTSTIDLSKGIDLAPDARIKIGVDAVAPVEVTLNNGTVPARKTLNEIVSAINGTIGATVASQDGKFLILASRERGANSKLVFLMATGTDATKGLFGFDAPRSYQASEARQAVLSGTKDLSGTVDVHEARFLRVSVDGRPPFVIDCGDIPGPAPDPTKATAEQIKTAINNGFLKEAGSRPGASTGLANIEDNRLVLRSSTVGAASRIAIEAHIAGDARKKIFGDVPDLTVGISGVPAEITGEVPILKAVNLTQFRHLLINVDSGRPTEVNIAGEEPTETTLTEIVSAINKVLPGVASSTPEGFLRLRSISSGPGSSIEVLPRRYIELIEHPLFDQFFDAGLLQHAQVITIHNAGVEDSVARVEITSLRGTVIPTVINHSAGRKIGLNGILRPGEKAIIEQDANARITMTRERSDGTRERVPNDIVVVKQAGTQSSGAGLELARGDTQWTFMEGLGPRFDEATFDKAYFAGTPSVTVGMFDLSLLDGKSDSEQSIFAPDPLPEASASVAFRWQAYQGGAFEMRLPSELRPVFGGRFNEARFGLGTVEEDGIRKALVVPFSGVVFDPPEDKDYIVRRFEKNSVDPRFFVVEASDAFTDPLLGFVANVVPFRAPRYLTRGDDNTEAKIFLREPDSGRLIQLKAAEPGEWGNQIAVAVRPDGPGRFQVEIQFAGDRFESARSLVAGPPEAPETKEGPLSLAPKQSPGVMRAKAAGVSAKVTRSRAGDSD